MQALCHGDHKKWAMLAAVMCVQEREKAGRTQIEDVDLGRTRVEGFAANNHHLRTDLQCTMAKQTRDGKAVCAGLDEVHFLEI